MFNKRWRNPTKASGSRGARLLSIYNSWYKMVSRCTNTKNKDWRYYGGRGITVCDSWLSYDNFYEWAMANGYNDTLTIDRIDVNGNYEPSNCRWVTRKVQARNTTRNVYIEGKCLAQIAEEHNLPVGLVGNRYRGGYRTIAELTTPVNELTATRRVDGKTLSQIAKESGIDINTIRGRWRRGDRTYDRLARQL